MVSNQGKQPVSDAEMLRERGFMVYTCNNALVSEMVNEVKPDIVFFNPEEPDPDCTKQYHNLLKDTDAADIPVIYTLLEDDIYLINLKRNKRNKKNLIADNIIDGIKTSLMYNVMPKKACKYISLTQSLLANSHRA